MLQAKDATILAQQVTMMQQQRQIGGDIVPNSLMPANGSRQVPEEKEIEELLGGVVERKSTMRSSAMSIYR